VDLPATIVELQMQEVAYQAALGATARAIQPSLMDFLR
jgi:flagellar hook-associated protein 3 FlgL